LWSDLIETGRCEVWIHLEDSFESIYTGIMSSIAEIKTAIENLSFSERAELAKWLYQWEDDQWDKQMAKDFSPGGRYADVPAEIAKKARQEPLLDLP
jgi:hypothetical protein